MNTFEKLVCSACFIVHNVLLDKAQGACVISEPIAYPLFDHFALLNFTFEGCARIGILPGKNWTHAFLFWKVLQFSELDMKVLCVCVERRFLHLLHVLGVVYGMFPLKSKALRQDRRSLERNARLLKVFWVIWLVC